MLKSPQQIVSALLLTGLVVSCGDPGGETLATRISVVVNDLDIDRVTFELSGGDLDEPLEGALNVDPTENPPVWATIMDLAPGDYTIVMYASNTDGDLHCEGSDNFTVMADQVTKVKLVLLCGRDIDDELGQVDVEATFEVVDSNRCPTVHLLSVIPDHLEPGEEAVVQVLAADPDSDESFTELRASAGTFGDATALETTYVCDGPGEQHIGVIVTDGSDECEKTKTVPVFCAGTGGAGGSGGSGGSAHGCD